MGKFSIDFSINTLFFIFFQIDEVELPFDKLKNQRRAFCFITFESLECVEKAVVLPKQKLGDKEVWINQSLPTALSVSLSN